MNTLPKYLTQDELTRFFAAITSPRDRALFGLIYHYGLRVGEALMLTVDDVNFKNHRITVRRLKNGLGGEKPLWRHTAKFLRAYLRERRDVGPYLFTGRKGPLQKRQVQKLFTDYVKAAGITERSVHALRHSMAVHLLEAGRGIEYGPTEGNMRHDPAGLCRKFCSGGDGGAVTRGGRRIRRPGRRTFRLP